jgi:hypothetical protein
MEKNNIQKQKIMCAKLDVDFYPSPLNFKVGISLNMKEKGLFPLNGLRHPPIGDTTGWYFWAGEEMSDNPDFFSPLHVEHLKEWCPSVIKFLGLPPGFRFLIGKDKYEDIWKDESLLLV